MANLSMDYFDDLQFIDGDVAPRCRARIDQRFTNFFSLQMVVDGEMSFSIGHGPVVVLGPGSLFWHHPTSSYQYGPHGGSFWHHAWVSFRGERGRRVIEEGFMPLSQSGSVVPADSFSAGACFRHLVGIIHGALPREHPRACLLLEELLVLSGNTDPIASQRPETHQAILAMAEQMRHSPGEAWDLETAARRAHVSPSHFRRLFRRLLNAPPQDFLIECRMRQAALRLRQTGRPIKAIAAECGYPDGAQFSRAFKRRTGFSPMAYREMMPEGRGQEEDLPD